MPKRNRTKEQRGAGSFTTTAGTAASSVTVPSRQDTEQERAAKLFAESIRVHEAADRAEQQRRRTEAEQAERHVALQRAKQAAAERIKQLRSSGGRREQVAEAEATYRLALAELQEFETGERPHWAPAPPPARAESDLADDSDPAVDPATDDPGTA